MVERLSENLHGFYSYYCPVTVVDTTTSLSVRLPVVPDIGTEDIGRKQDY